MTRPRLRRVVLLGWGVTAALLVLVAWPAIRHLWFPDGDDAMRMLEVRDWIGGQSWWDVSQHRLWGGQFQMHWSRIVDLPLAAMMAGFDPLVGQAASTRVALTVVPLLILLAVIALATRMTALLAGPARAPYAVLLVAMTPQIVYQMRPMRIDHHGWQVMLALGAVAALLSRPTRAGGAAAGLCLAALVCVSLEGLPITAAILGTGLLAWAHDPTRRAQALAMTVSLVGGVVVLHVATRGSAMLLPACDAIAPAWIAALAVAAAVTTATLLLAPTRPRAFAIRAGGIVAAAVAAAAVLRLAAPLCTRGPFATLDPLVYSVWYRNVPEGMPIWDQQAGPAILAYALPLVGLPGTALALRASTGAARVRWAMMLAIAGAAFAFSLLIIRGAATANALAVPGAAWLLSGWLARARAIPATLPRIAATAAALVAAAPWLPGVVLVGDQIRAHAAAGTRRAAGGAQPGCTDGREAADLRVLPPSTIFVPLELAPPLLGSTPHRAIGSGYHRNVAAIHRVLQTFMATPETAHRLILASGADYVAGCPGENETQIYKHLAPDGFWARLEQGERFGWLRPVALPGSSVLAWQVVKLLPGHARRP